MKPAAAANFPTERLQYQQVSGRAGFLERDDRGASLTRKTRPHGGGRPAGGTGRLLWGGVLIAIRGVCVLNPQSVVYTPSSVPLTFSSCA